MKKIVGCSFIPFLFMMTSYSAFSFSKNYLDKLDWKMNEKAVHQLEHGSKFKGKYIGDGTIDRTKRTHRYVLQFQKKVLGFVVIVNYLYLYTEYFTGKKNRKLLSIYFTLLKGNNYSSKFNKKFYALVKRVSGLFGKPYKQKVNTFEKDYYWKYKDKTLLLYFEENNYTYNCIIKMVILPIR